MSEPRSPGRPGLLRLLNDRTALDLLLMHGPLSRVHLCELTGLSRPTASQLLGRLERSGLVQAVGTSSGGPGPRAVLYAVRGAAGHVGALDVTARRVSATVADLTGRVLGEEVVVTRLAPDRSPAALARGALAAAAAQGGLAPDALDAVAIGVPGAYDAAADRVAMVDRAPGWGAPQAIPSIRAALPRSVVLVENDVNLAAVAERRHGVARGCDSFAVLWVSTGLGLAIDLGGTLHRGATGGAGEVGYMPVLGQRRSARPTRFQDLVGAAAVRGLAAAHGIRARSAAEAVARAVAAADGVQDAAAIAFVDEVAARLAAGLAIVASVLDPHLVVLSGDVCRAGGPGLARRVQRDLRRLTQLRPRLEVSGVPGNPVRLGALDLALRHTRDALFGASASPAAPVRDAARST